MNLTVFMLTQMMPYLFRGIAKHAPDYTAWRWAFFVPGAMHVLVSLLIVAFGQVKILAVEAIIPHVGHPKPLI